MTVTRKVRRNAVRNAARRRARKAPPEARLGALVAAVVLGAVPAMVLAVEDWFQGQVTPWWANATRGEFAWAIAGLLGVAAW